MEIESTILKSLLQNGPLVAVLGYMALVFYKDRKASDAKFSELSERGIKAIENSNHIASENGHIIREQGVALNRIMERMEVVNTTVLDCHKHRAAMMETQRMFGAHREKAGG